MKLETIILSKLTQEQKTKHRMFSFLFQLQLWLKGANAQLGPLHQRIQAPFLGSVHMLLVLQVHRCQELSTSPCCCHVKKDVFASPCAMILSFLKLPQPCRTLKITLRDISFKKKLRKIPKGRGKYPKEEENGYGEVSLSHYLEYIIQPKLYKRLCSAERASV
ncbi:hypothetical protein AAY473_016723 [Plecturocebus cupreus]